MVSPLPKHWFNAEGAKLAVRGPGWMKWVKRSVYVPDGDLMIAGVRLQCVQRGIISMCT